MASFIKRPSALLQWVRRRTVRARDYSFVPGRRTTFRETCGARAVPFGIVLNVNRLGAFTLLVIVAQTTGMRLLAFLTEFRSHLTPLSLDFEDPFELIRSVVKVCKAETTIRQQAFTVSA